MPLAAAEGLLSLTVGENGRARNPRMEDFLVRTMDRVVREFFARERLLAIPPGVIGAVSLLITLVGLYTARSYGVTRRRRETGIHPGAFCPPRRWRASCPRGAPPAPTR